MARVLILDDKPEIRLLLKAAVEREGHSALLAADAGQAWHLLGQKPDIMFADIGLPGEDGLDFTMRVRSNPEHSSLPVVFVTAYADAEIRVQAEIRAPVAVLEKPFRFEQVARLLRDLTRVRDDAATVS